MIYPKEKLSKRKNIKEKFILKKGRTINKIARAKIYKNALKEKMFIKKL